MGSYTPNHNLFLPDLDDVVDVDVDINDNFSKLDEATSVVVISPTAPDISTLPSKYLWIQTGLGGGGFTFWLEDGA